jgi:hypothetical protein
VVKLKKQLRDPPDDETGTSSEAHFVSRVESSMTRGFYYLLSGTRLQSLQLLRLDGTMRFSLNAKKNAIVPGVFYGQIAAKSSAPAIEDAAFVVFSDSALTFRPLSGGNFSAKKTGKQDSYEYARDGKTWTLSVQDEGLFDVMTSMSFKIGQSEYIYVKWKPDEQNSYGGCERQYSLFAVDQELKLVLSARSGCDV